MARQREVLKHVKSLYDRQPEREWQRMDRHRTEFAVTLRALAEHLPSTPARVLDCGGGPGRYAIELAGQGYDVTVFDLSSECLRLAGEKAQEIGVTLSAYEQGSATDLSRFADGSFDAVLLMGPLYHLLEESCRRRALLEAHRVLKPGGVLFAVFITRYAPIRYAAAHEPMLPIEQPGLMETILNTGWLPPRGETGAHFVAYFCHPSEVAPLCWQTGFEPITTLGVEGVVSELEGGVNALTGKAWDVWVDVNHRLAQDPAIQGGVEHLLAIARKPRWRAVLRRIARRLNGADVCYTVVGGSSIALHGVPTVTGDLDIETDADGAYRIQELFLDHIVKKVALSQSEAYRSHLGRIELDGVTVEIIGDLHRLEADGWVPTAARTETVIALDGVPVSVSWLEEETLAYVRRGRLERAAQCLPYCDRDRLLALLRGGKDAGVF